MQRKGARHGGDHDVEATLDELYTVPPPGFVPRREELAAAARTAGRVEDARRIHAARRPTLAAWAANLLLRSRPEESRRFLELGRALREAYQSLDTSGVKQLSEQRRGIVTSLSLQAARLARESGHRLSDTAQRDVESTLHAVLTDPAAADQWAAGRLTGALTPPADFPSAAAASAGTRPKRTGDETPPSGSRAGDDLAERRGRRLREQLAQARRTAKAADRRLRDLRTARTAAGTALEQARARLDRAQRQVTAVERQLGPAREEFQQADREHKEAAERHRAAAGAVTRAERAAGEAAQEVERLSGPDSERPVGRRPPR
ncbi:hypothetical protein [Streptomyces sp. NPDC002588]|uniref:hypothetical protein n=1 Tax=Streptomyces sp. NPDC002588 TaxID=3154419 RepID=UPI0033276CD3